MSTRSPIICTSSWARWWRRIPDVFESVRGQGLMIGLKMKAASGDFIAAARANGLIVLPAGENVVRLLPPLDLERSRSARRRGTAGQDRRPQLEAQKAAAQ